MQNNKLTNIIVQGFKSIKNCNINLTNLNVLIGSNGAGKSNFISLFTLLDKILMHKLQEYVEECKGANTFLYNGDEGSKCLSLDFVFEKNNYKFTLKKLNNTLIFENESFKILNKELKTSHTHYESRIDELKLSDIFLLRVYHFYDTSKNATVKLSQKIIDNHELHFDAGNLASFLFKLKNECKKEYLEIIKTIQIIAPYFEEFILEKNEDSIALNWKQINSETTLSVDQLSDGTLRFICLATLLLQPKELQPSIIIIDEPELGLHPFAIIVLAELVKKASLQTQIILSTQSVEFLNELSANDIVVVDRNEEGTIFNRLDEEKLKEWLDNDYNLGELWKKNLLGGRLSK